MKVSLLITYDIGTGVTSVIRKALEAAGHKVDELGASLVDNYEIDKFLNTPHDVEIIHGVKHTSLYAKHQIIEARMTMENTCNICGHAVENQPCQNDCGWNICKSDSCWEKHWHLSHTFVPKREWKGEVK